MEILVAIVSALLLLWITWRWQVTSTFQKLGISGPKPNLLFGNLVELYWKGPLQCHEEWVKKYGRVVGYYYGMKPVLLVADPFLLKNIFVKDFPKFINREPFNPLTEYDPHYELGQSILILPGQAWKDVRSVLTPTFTTAKMKQMSESMRSSIEDMLGIMRDLAARGKAFDICDVYQRLTMDVITRTAFGVRTDVQTNHKSKILRATRSLISTYYRDPMIFLGVSFPFLRRFCLRLQEVVLGIRNRGTAPHKMLRGGISEVLQHRRENPQAKKSDLLQLMIDAEISTDVANVEVSQLEAGNVENENRHDSEECTGKQSRKLSDGEIISSAFIVLLAGYETTSTALAFTTYLLAKHQDVQEKLFQSIHQLIQSGQKLEYATINKLPYLDYVFSESMRIYPPVYLFTNRYAVEDVQYGDLKIPKGMLIRAPVHLLHHDPEFWSEPEIFDPERFNQKPNMDGITYLPFGVGPRNCLGMRFAQLEGKLALAHTVYKFRMHLGDRHKGNLQTRIRIRFFTPADGVHVLLESRQEIVEGRSN